MSLTDRQRKSLEKLIILPEVIPHLWKRIRGSASARIWLGNHYLAKASLAADAIVNEESEWFKHGIHRSLGRIKMRTTMPQLHKMSKPELQIFWENEVGTAWTWRAGSTDEDTVLIEGYDPRMYLVAIKHSNEETAAVHAKSGLITKVPVIIEGEA